MERSVLERLIFVFSVICLGLAISAESACQKDYEFAPDATASGTPAATATPCDPDDEDCEDLEPTSTATATVAPTETPELEETDTPTPTPTTDSAAALGQVASVKALLGALVKSDTGDSNSAGQAPSISANNPEKRSAPSNWLGGIYSKRDSEAGTTVDTDGDGYSDSLERDTGSDPLSSASIPPPPVTILAERMRGFDDDGDGLGNSEESSYGTDADSPDSDGDNILDGIEVLSGTNPASSESRPLDSDGDGLSDDYERYLGTRPNDSDSDGDGVRDDLEIALGSNPLDTDSDRDGILDGRELALGADPALPERRL